MIAQILAKYKFQILIALVVIAILYWIYRKGKASGSVPTKLKIPNSGKGIPLGWSPTQDVISLHDAMEGWGTDEEIIFNTLDGLTRDQLSAIYNEYGNRYKKDIIQDFESELSGDNLKRAINYFKEMI